MPTYFHFPHLSLRSKRQKGESYQHCWPPDIHQTIHFRNLLPFCFMGIAVACEVRSSWAKEQCRLGPPLRKLRWAHNHCSQSFGWNWPVKIFFTYWYKLVEIIQYHKISLAKYLLKLRHHYYPPFFSPPSTLFVKWTSICFHRMLLHSLQVWLSDSDIKTLLLSYMCVYIYNEGEW